MNLAFKKLLHKLFSIVLALALITPLVTRSMDDSSDEEERELKRRRTVTEQDYQADSDDPDLSDLGEEELNEFMENFVAGAISSRSSSREDLAEQQSASELEYEFTLEDLQAILDSLSQPQQNTTSSESSFTPEQQKIISEFISWLQANLPAS